MSNIHIHRDHTLGLAKARRVTQQWIKSLKNKYDMQCSITEGDGEDVVAFERAGVDGKLVVAADSFDLTARLGLLVGAFGERIEAEINASFDALLSSEATKPAKAKGGSTKRSSAT